MPTYSKTVYIEILADNEDDATEGIGSLLEPIQNDPNNNVSYVDLEGPIEEVEGLSDVETQLSELEEIVANFPANTWENYDETGFDIVQGWILAKRVNSVEMAPDVRQRLVAAVEELLRQNDVREGFEDLHKAEMEALSALCDD